jgi:uncharacterized membrane protein YphA (DoxX/SURF4 family)
MKNRAVDWTALLLRVVVGLIFIPHGFAKVFGTGSAAAFSQDIPRSDARVLSLAT